MENSELIKFIFNDSKKINNSDYSWKFLKQVLNAKTKNFKLDIYNANDLFIWKNGTWLDGTWYKGIWKEGTWYNGIWKYGDWKGGEWHNGTWERGYWKDGIWHDGAWKYGSWYDGTWYNGYWYDGKWYGGEWIDGTWKGGEWIKGKIYNPKTKQYEYSNVSPNECEWSLSYGK